MARHVVEIGFGNGDHLVELASAHPEDDFIGIEVHPPGVGHLLLKAHAANLTNLRVFNHDAMEVLAQMHRAGFTGLHAGAVSGPVAQGAPSQAAPGQCGVCNTRRHRA